MRMLPFAILLLVSTTAALGADTCRTGDATVGDQRALRSVRDTTEATCPCATATNRGAWRKCAKGVLNAALASSTLRLECRKTGVADLKTATCGTDRLACGRVKGSGKTPVGCAVTPAAKCTDRARVAQTPCTAQTHCSDVVEWTAGTCDDPRADGPGHAGMMIVPMTKDSVVHPGTPRTLNTYVYYPTSAAGPVDPGEHAILNAPVAPGGPYPLLIFSHGLCGTANGQKFLMPLLASWGFIVASPPHPGSTLGDYPACSSTTNIIESALERPADAIFVVDTMLAASANAGSPFAGAVDGTRIGMSGHSFGGFTTFRAVTQDARFRAALLFAPAVPADMPAITVPSLMMLGEVDSVTIGGSASNNDTRRAAWALASPPKRLVEILDAGHFAFSDGCFPGPDCNPPVTLTQDESHDIVRRWALPFLQVYLAGDTGWMPFLDPPVPPGVLFQQE
jgi:predicted dienelactone hydrolase